MGIDPVPSLLFVVILATQNMLFSSHHKGKGRGTFTPCYASQNFSVEEDIRYEHVLGIELVFVLGKLRMTGIINGRPMGKRIKKRRYFNY